MENSQLWWNTQAQTLLSSGKKRIYTGKCNEKWHLRKIMCPRRHHKQSSNTRWWCSGRSQELLYLGAILDLLPLLWLLTSEDWERLGRPVGDEVGAGDPVGHQVLLLLELPLLLLLPWEDHKLGKRSLNKDVQFPDRGVLHEVHASTDMTNMRTKLHTDYL